MGSKPSTAHVAITKQKVLEVKMSFIVFDCLRYGGVDLIDFPLWVRRSHVETALTSIWTDGVPGVEKRHAFRISELVPIDQGFLEEILPLGAEGIMVKDPEAPYHPGQRKACWLKIQVCGRRRRGDHR